MIGTSWQPTTHRRRGAVTVLVVMFLFIFVTLAAMAVDLGYLAMARAQMQRTADSAALAAMWEYAIRVQGGANPIDARGHAFAHSADVTEGNKIANASPSLHEADLRWGYLANFADRGEPLDTTMPAAMTNAVTVTIQRTESRNGRIPSFFARIMGVPGFAASNSATAGMVRNIRGFTSPSDGSDLHILPLTIDEATWDDLLNGGGADDWSFDPSTKSVTPGPDGVREVNLYPSGPGDSGSRGTLDIGAYSSDPSEIDRQIVDGISSDDLSHHGGALLLNANGKLTLHGASGIHDGFGESLASVQGAPRVVPIFREVYDSGGNLQYTIVRFGGVRVMEVDLTTDEDNKRVIIQPAPIVMKGIVPSAGFTQQSDFVYSSAILVR